MNQDEGFRKMIREKLSSLSHAQLVKIITLAKVTKKKASSKKKRPST